MPENKRKEKQLRIRRTNPQSISPVFANDFLVTHSPQGFFLTFSMIEPPAILSEEDWELTDKVEAKAVAKIVVPPAFLSRILKVMEDNLRKYEDKGLDRKEDQGSTGFVVGIADEE